MPHLRYIFDNTVHKHPLHVDHCESRADDLLESELVIRCKKTGFTSCDLHQLLQGFLQAALRGDLEAVARFISLGIDLECCNGVSYETMICLCHVQAVPV